jgi:hypothetical protein
MAGQARQGKTWWAGGRHGSFWQVGYVGSRHVEVRSDEARQVWTVRWVGAGIGSAGFGAEWQVWQVRCGEVR